MAALTVGWSVVSACSRSFRKVGSARARVGSNAATLAAAARDKPLTCFVSHTTLRICSLLRSIKSLTTTGSSDGGRACADEEAEAAEVAAGEGFTRRTRRRLAAGWPSPFAALVGAASGAGGMGVAGSAASDSRSGAAAATAGSMMIHSSSSSESQSCG
jgi:hypothetical protein